MPKRIQRLRKKGWKAPEGAVYVGRPSKWGNPFIASNDDPRRPLESLDYRHILAPINAARAFRDFVTKHGSWFPIPPHRWPKGKIPAHSTFIEDVRRELRGKDLMCWCPLDQPCHADVLLELANQPASAEAQA
jgi:hypothetical protein